MKRRRLVGTLVLILLAAKACSLSLAGGDSGSVALVPYFNEELGIRGVEPLQGWTDQAQLVQLSFPGTTDELIAKVLADISLTQLPEPTGSYKGTTFIWDLYAFEAQIIDVGSEVFRVDLALAEGDSASYLVALATLPDAYDADAPLYETVFTHAVYALAPLE
jgi:hypothetical protein